MVLVSGTIGGQDVLTRFDATRGATDSFVVGVEFEARIGFAVVEDCFDLH